MAEKVLAAMSGGVDSSVAALLLHNAGYTVEGATMYLRLQEGAGMRRCGHEAVEDAARVCEKLGIPHHVIDLTRDFRETVIDRFVDEYRRGRTPNPCINCNRFIKFGALRETAHAMGFDFIATGHYARIECGEDGYRLMKPKDRAKDQTYFLYSIRKESLRSILFPLACVSKEEVRTLAGKTRLPVADKPESQDICFITQKDYRTFLRDVAGEEKPGLIVNTKGHVLGRHRGIGRFTIGQRSGLGISAKAPLYVVSIDAKENRVVVGEKNELAATGLLASDINMFVPGVSGTAEAKVRYRKRAFPCRFVVDHGILSVIFAEPQESVTPGQAVVLYRGDEVLGGGVIERAAP